MSHINWGEIAKKFDLQARQQEIQKKQHNLYLKALYKQQLQQMIAEQKAKAQDYKKHDRELIKQQQHRDEFEMAKEKQKNRTLKRMKEKFSIDNLQTLVHKRQQQLQSRQKQKQFLNQNFRKAATEMSEQNKKYAQYKSQAKSILSHAYDQQINIQQKRKLTEKVQERKYSLLALEQENKKQTERMKRLNKLKFGYHQNPETYHYAENVLKKNLENRNKFINDMSSQNSRILEQYSRRKRDQDRKKTQLKNISAFNRAMIEETIFKKKYQSTQDILQQHERLQTIHGDLQKQAKRKQFEKLSKQQKLKQQLQRQIQQSQSMKTKQKYLNFKQQNLNRDILSNSGHAVLPGLAQDYTYKRQQKLLQNFLKGPHTHENYQN